MTATPHDHAPSLAPNRRTLLASSSALFAWSLIPRFAQAAQGRDPRFVTLILRGAMDGLSAVAPMGDPDYAALREGIALSASGDKPAVPLDGYFALHPAMPNFARLYKAGQALVVHAVATPYRERSHFDGQDLLESGYEKVGFLNSGWLNRALQALPGGARVEHPSGLGVGTMTPLILRGAAPVLGWTPPEVPKADEDFAQRVKDLYAARDSHLYEALSEGLRTDALAAQSGMDDAIKARGGEIQQMKTTAAGAARLLASDGGPRIAALSFNGWDTHANEGGATGRLAQLLGGLDTALATFEQGLRPVWHDTVLLIVTEFGRTAKVNGTVGTDHGTATVAFLVGGGVKGGRVVADWPGLKPAQLFEGRDLKPTTDLRAIAKGILAGKFGLSTAVLGQTVFPGSADVAPLPDLVT